MKKGGARRNEVGLRQPKDELLVFTVAQKPLNQHAEAIAPAARHLGEHQQSRSMSSAPTTRSWIVAKRLPSPTAAVSTRSQVFS